MPLRSSVRCREIDRADIEATISVLSQGFPNHDSNYWARALARLTEHRAPPGFPKYGYLLEADGRPIGVILVICSEMPDGSQTRYRVNIASWYVEPQYRSYAPMLTSRAHAHRGVTYLQLTPAPHVLPIIEAQGYRPYAEGTYAAAALLCAPPQGARVRVAARDLQSADDMSQAECDLLVDHRGYGCISVVCTLDGRRHPFVFARRWRRARLGRWPYARLIYCRGLDEFARFAGPLGRFLALRGMPLVGFDANAPLHGVPGRFLPGGAKFFKGPHMPRLGDISYTELSMFG
jgi:hypothetical protein